MGDSTVESSWTISILSPELSWLDTTSSSSSSSSPTKNESGRGESGRGESGRGGLRNVIQIFFCGGSPFIPIGGMSTILAEKVVAEKVELVKTHKIRGITKALLQIRSILDKSEAHYFGNKLFIDPYLYWIQNLDDGDSGGSGSGSCVLNRIISGLEDVNVDVDVDSTMNNKNNNNNNDSAAALPLIAS